MTSACVALVAPGNHVLMVKASYKNEWTFPSGVVDMGESPAQAAQRELFRMMKSLPPNGFRFLR
ncbi:NUDIX hydrolase [Candidatus Saccharibacteria bacterium]|nr:NUDIX hydrolase [Candidatus Saccharibacteria bacterium]